MHTPCSRNMKYLRPSCALIVLCTLALFLFHLTWRHLSISGQNRYTQVEVTLSNTGQIKILQLADVQIGGLRDACKDLTPSEKQWPCDAENTTAFISRLIEHDRPDIVVFTGDNVYGTRSDQYSQYVLKLITKPIVSAGIPFAIVTGNHDVELPWMSVTALHDFMRKERASGGGGALISGNGLIKVNSIDNHTQLHIWLFEYMHSSCVFCYNGAGHGSYHSITKEQIEFFQRNSQMDILSLAFTHVPVQEYHQITQQIGSQHDTITDSGPGELYTALSQRKVTALSVGHDHTNDFCGQINGGIYLCYAGGAGYTTYGKVGWSRRARMFVVNDNMIRTYKRLDDHNFSRIHDQHLYERFLLEI